MAATLVRMWRVPVLRRLTENSNSLVLAKHKSQVNFKLPRHRALRPWNARAKLTKPTKFSSILTHNTKAVFWGSHRGVIPWGSQATPRWWFSEWFRLQ